MEWLKEILGDNYTEEISKKVGVVLETDYAPRSELESAVSGKESIEAQLKEANTTIEGLKGQDIESVQKAAEDWEKRFTDLKAESEKNEENLRFNADFEKAVLKCKGRSAPAIRAELGEEKIQELKKSGNRLEDMVKSLETHRTEKAFLYDLSDAPPTPPVGTGSAKVNEPAGNGGMRESITAALFPQK